MFIKICFILLLLFPLTSVSQSVHFEKGISLETLMENAKKEKKYVFIDVYTTWCGPCKKMESETFTDSNVGNLLNDNFLSIRIQIDKTLHDDESIKLLYKDAEFIFKHYKIEAFPTILYLNPFGQLVNKTIGFQNYEDLVKATSVALSEERSRYYSSLAEFTSGIFKYKEMPNLIKITQELLADQILINNIAKEYKIGFLDKLSQQEWLKKENLEFISDFTSFVSSKDLLFTLAYYHPEKIDSALKDIGWSDRLVKNVISREEIWNKLCTDSTYKIAKSKNPNWSLIAKSISLKYKKVYADVLIPNIKLSFYKLILKDWHTFSILRDIQIKNHPPERTKGMFDPNSTTMLNSDAWDVFRACNDTNILRKALRWVNMAIKLEQPNPNVQYLDTKANLLYKLGNVDEAILTERKAIEYDNELAKKKGQIKGYFVDSYNEIINKMAAGQPTW